MNNSFLKRVLQSSRFKFYSTIISAGTTGGVFVYFLCANQMNYLKDRNEDLGKNYELSKELDRKKCELEQKEMKTEIESSMYQQYKKLDGKSREAALFLETYKLIKFSKDESK